MTELEQAQLSLPAQWKDLIKLPYLDACIKESFRLCPGVGLILEREVPDGGFTLPDGRFIPVGTKVGLNPAVVTHDEGIFGDDVDDYVPERWFQKDDESDADFASRLRRMQDVTDFMFGTGSRVCVGRNMAKLEMYKLVATLYSTFDVSSPSWFYHGLAADIQADQIGRSGTRVEVLQCLVHVSQRHANGSSTEGGKVRRGIPESVQEIIAVKIEDFMAFSSCLGVWV